MLGLDAAPAAAAADVATVLCRGFSRKARHPRQENHLGPPPGSSSFIYTVHRR